MERAIMTRILAAASLMFLTLPASASSCKSLAKKFVSAAAAAGVRRVAILPLVPLDGSDEAEGRRIAEELAMHMTLRGQITVVERSMLPELMEEHRLGRTGALDPGSLRRVGALLQAEAVVLGTFVALGDTVEVNVRVVDIETGAMLAARSARLERVWSPAMRGVIPEPAPISPNLAVADVYEYQTGRRYRPQMPSSPQPALRREASKRAVLGYGALRDAVRDDCTDAAGRIDVLQEDILELKARYWAGQATRRGFSARNLKAEPAAVISSPELRERFFELIQVEAERSPRPLSMTEVRRFVAADMESFRLYGACGLSQADGRIASLPEGPAGATHE